MTVGISPKVKNPALLLVGVGVALVVLGVLLPDGDLRTIGLTALGSGVAGFGAGYAADPGQVVTAIGKPSDEALSPEALARIEQSGEVEPDLEAGYASPAVLLILLGVVIALLVHWGLGLALAVVGLVLLVLPLRAD